MCGPERSTLWSGLVCVDTTIVLEARLVHDSVVWVGSRSRGKANGQSRGFSCSWVVERSKAVSTIQLGSRPCKIVTWLRCTILYMV
jgi:hypothetical protein